MDPNEVQHADKQMLPYKEQLNFPTQYYKTHYYSYTKYKPVIENSSLLLQFITGTQALRKIWKKIIFTQAFYVSIK
jgi:hypothetical protein